MLLALGAPLRPFFLYSGKCAKISWMEKREEQAELHIYPLSKGKRVIAFIADFFLSFIISFALFHLAFYPLISYSSGLYEDQTASIKAQKDRDAVLYKNNLLYFESEQSDDEPSSFSKNLQYTCKSYVFSLINGDSSTDVFRHYFIDIKGHDESNFASWIQNNDESTGFFLYSPEVSLLSTYVEEFSPIFEEGNAPSKQGEEDYERFEKKFFLPAYSKMLTDIQENDLTFAGISYNEQQAIVSSFSKKANAVVIAAASSSYVLSICVIFLIIPLFSKTRRTLGMVFLKRERVNSLKLMPLRKKDVILPSLYALFADAGLLFLLPWPIVSFNELFSISGLWILSLISVFFDFLSLIFLLFDQLDRTLSDRLTSSVMIDEDTMGAIYRAKGYGEY